MVVNNKFYCIMKGVYKEILTYRNGEMDGEFITLSSFSHASFGSQNTSSVSPFINSASSPC